jgi:hypothetical protein
LRPAEVAKPPGEAFAWILCPLLTTLNASALRDTAGSSISARQINRRLLAADGASRKRTVRAPIRRIGVAPTRMFGACDVNRCGAHGTGPEAGQDRLRENAMFIAFSVPPLSGS